MYMNYSMVKEKNKQTEKITSSIIALSTCDAVHLIWLRNKRQKIALIGQVVNSHRIFLCFSCVYQKQLLWSQVSTVCNLNASWKWMVYYSLAVLIKKIYKIINYAQ